MPCFPNILSSLRLFICAWIGSHLLEQTTRGPFLWRKLTLPTPATFKCQSASSIHYWHFDRLDLVQATRATEFISEWLHCVYTMLVLKEYSRISGSQVPLPSSTMFPERGGCVIERCPFRWHSTVPCSLHCDLLWVSTFIPMHWWKSMGLEIMLFVPMSV